jgi:hypothetical protein
MIGLVTARCPHRPGSSGQMNSSLWSGLGSSDAGLPLHPQSDQRPRTDGDGADLVGAFVSARFAATLPFARGEHLPAASLVGHAAFWHPASYLTKARRGKAAGATDSFVSPISAQ